MFFNMYIKSIFIYLDQSISLCIFVSLSKNIKLFVDLFILKYLNFFFFRPTNK